MLRFAYTDDIMYAMTPIQESDVPTPDSNAFAMPDAESDAGPVHFLDPVLGGLHALPHPLGARFTGDLREVSCDICRQVMVDAVRADNARRRVTSPGVRVEAMTRVMSAERAAEKDAPRHMPCDMGCQPDWHHDDCAIYLPAPDDATCLRCEAAIHLDDRGVWRSLIGEATCYRNPARDGHEPRVTPSAEKGQADA